MKTEPALSKPNVYFTFSPTEAGFTDQLFAFSIYYKLGLSLGYQYIHTPFQSSHSSSLPETQNNKFPMGTTHLFAKIFRRLRRKFQYYWNRTVLNQFPDPYDFLGFNSYLAKRNSPIPNRNLTKIVLPLGDSVLRENDLNTFEEIQNFVSDSIYKSINAQKDLLVVFKATSFPFLMGQLVHSSIPDFQDGLDLNKAYFDARQINPWKPIFEKNSLKMMIHIRQGDVAVIETPWETCIPVWEKNLVEYPNFQDIQYDNRVLHLDEYSLFTERLQAHLKDITFSSLVFSNGFSRAFSQFHHKGMESLNITTDQEKSLLESVETYDEKAFKKFSGLSNSTLVLGENSEKLCDLIHSILLADLIIIGPRGGLVPKFLATYRNTDNMPIVIVLHKGTPPPFSHTDYMGLHDNISKFIDVNILEDDLELVFSKLDKMLSHLQYQELSFHENLQTV